MALLLFFPESPLWIVLTLFPVTAPIQVMLRIGVSTVATWEIAASIGILVVSIVLGTFVSIKVFRLHMLMTGKRPTIGEIVRQLRAGK
jgi:ABC-2 type transport system permease protein